MESSVQNKLQCYRDLFLLIGECRYRFISQLHVRKNVVKIRAILDYIVEEFEGNKPEWKDELLSCLEQGFQKSVREYKEEEEKDNELAKDF